MPGRQWFVRAVILAQFDDGARQVLGMELNALVLAHAAVAHQPDTQGRHPFARRSNIVALGDHHVAAVTAAAVKVAATGRTLAGGRDYFQEVVPYRHQEIMQAEPLHPRIAVAHRKPKHRRKVSLHRIKVARYQTNLPHPQHRSAPTAPQAFLVMTEWTAITPPRQSIDDYPFRQPLFKAGRIRYGCTQHRCIIKSEMPAPNRSYDSASSQTPALCGIAMMLRA